MRKIPPVAILTFILSFIAIFIYFYKNTKNFRKSLSSAVLFVILIFGYPLESQSKTTTDAFTPEPRKPINRPGLFSRPNELGGSPAGSPGGDERGDEGIPQDPKPESIEETE